MNIGKWKREVIIVPEPIRIEPAKEEPKRERQKEESPAVPERVGV